MPNAAKVLTVSLGLAALAACHKQPQANASANDDMSIEDNLTANQVPSNAEIETLPADESDSTSSAELNRGNDNPDVSDVGNND